MKRLVIISYSFPPSNAPAAQRPYTIAKYLGRAGYSVTVLSCANQDSSLGVAPGCLHNTAFVHYKVPGLSLAWLRRRKNKHMAVGQIDSEASLVKKTPFPMTWVFPDKAFSWFPFSLLWCLFHPKTFLKSSLLTSSPLATNHLLGLVLKLLFRPRWIADIRDFHYLNGYDRHPKSVKSRMHRWLESRVIDKADAVTFISNTMLQTYAKHYQRQAPKFHVVYNGFDPDDYKPEKKAHSPELEQSPIRILYAGSFYSGVRSPVPLIKALQILVDSRQINPEEIVIEIAGNFERALFQEIASCSVSKQITFFGTVSHDEALKLMKKAHLLWLIVGEQFSHSAGIPLKTFEYIASGRPILCFAPDGTEVAHLVTEFRLGWVLSNRSDKMHENAEVLRNILNRKLYQRFYADTCSSRMASFNRQHQASQFAKLLFRESPKRANNGTF